MEALDFIAREPAVFIVVIALFSLLVGSFLNVVIYRLPVMMERTWRKECLEYLGQPPDPNVQEPFNLVLPQSRCQACGTPIKSYQNIPVISYLALGGKCAQCKTPIAIRYPLIEAFTALLSAMVAWHFGFSTQTAFALLLTWSLIALSFIDIDHHLLPDSITLPILWLGLLLSLSNVYVDSHASIIGAIAGYLILWGVFHAFKLLTGKEGMGYGDFKLLSLFGAWLGWQALPAIILLSSLVGAIVGTAMIALVKHDRQKPIPFGPYLAAAGWLTLLWGDNINQTYLKFAGL